MSEPSNRINAKLSLVLVNVATDSRDEVGACPLEPFPEPGPTLRFDIETEARQKWLNENQHKGFVAIALDRLPAAVHRDEAGTIVGLTVRLRGEGRFYLPLVKIDDEGAV